MACLNLIVPYFLPPGFDLIKASSTQYCLVTKFKYFVLLTIALAAILRPKLSDLKIYLFSVFLNGTLCSPSTCCSARFALP